MCFAVPVFTLYRIVNRTRRSAALPYQEHGCRRMLAPMRSPCTGEGYIISLCSRALDRAPAAVRLEDLREVQCNPPASQWAYSSSEYLRLCEEVGGAVQAGDVSMNYSAVGGSRNIPRDALHARSTRAYAVVFVAPWILVKIGRDGLLVAIASASHIHPVEPLSAPYGQGVHPGARRTRHVNTGGNQGGRTDSHNDTGGGSREDHRCCSRFDRVGGRANGVCVKQRMRANPRNSP